MRTYENIGKVQHLRGEIVLYRKRYWTVDGYCQINKAYLLTSTEDINRFLYVKKDISLHVAEI